MKALLIATIMSCGSAGPHPCEIISAHDMDLQTCVRAPLGTDCGRFSHKEYEAWRRAHPEDRKAGDAYMKERDL